MKSTSIIYRILALSMALLMFFSSVGYTVDMHFCKGQLKTFSLIGKAKSCHEVGQGMKNCPHHKKMMAAKKTTDATIAKKGCCSNKTLRIQSDQDQQNQFNKITLLDAPTSQLVAVNSERFSITPILETEKSSYAHYKPPSIPEDRYVLFETFLL